MSQGNVERVIGRLATDDGFRRRFAQSPTDVLRELADQGLELNPCERRALRGIDLRLLARFAEALDPCILKIELSPANAGRQGGRT